MRIKSFVDVFYWQGGVSLSQRSIWNSATACLQPFYEFQKYLEAETRQKFLGPLEALKVFGIHEKACNGLKPDFPT
ncbi:hypothetical protein CEXT_759121 [Caerostris extrusa]|uniref:Uncharacterized protein n=1 Tax=Caerostris extrusa TaxID=172846 RepID=A0AAV4QZ36_CAEEX|nr:hypothetical protein CEXT_759121 [Caerostris extrusa]